MTGGGATWHVNHLVPITRHGRREDVYWTYSYSPIDDDTAPRGVGGVLVVCTETTAQVRAVQALERERDRLAQLFERSPIFLAMLSGPEHRIESGQSWLYAVGSPSAGAASNGGGGDPRGCRPGIREIARPGICEGVPYTALGAAYMVQTQPGGPGEERVIDFVYQPIKNPEGAVTGIFVQGADVTDRAVSDAALKASEARLREIATQLTEANRLKDEFLATLSHEMRTPLNATRLRWYAPVRNDIARPDRSRIRRRRTECVGLATDH